MSSSSYEKTFEIPTPILDGSVIAQISDANRLNFISFQLAATISGATPNVTFTVLQKNDKKAAWFSTTITKNFNSAGIKNDFIEVDWAKATAYALKVTLTAGAVDGLKVYAAGKG